MRQDREDVLHDSIGLLLECLQDVRVEQGPVEEDHHEVPGDAHRIHEMVERLLRDIGVELWVLGHLDRVQEGHDREQNGPVGEVDDQVDHLAVVQVPAYEAQQRHYKEPPQHVLPVDLALLDGLLVLAEVAVEVEPINIVESPDPESNFLWTGLSCFTLQD